MSKFSAIAVCLAALTVAPLIAQGPAARKFLPQNHTNLIYADLAALRDRGIWDDLEASVLKMAFKAITEQLGSPLAAIDRVTMVAVFSDPDAAARRVKQVLVLEGNRPLGAPADASRWDEIDIGSTRARRGANETFVQPEPKLQVIANHELVEAGLAVGARPGLPCPDVLSLLSGRGDALAYFVLDIANPMMRRGLQDGLEITTDWPEDDGPKFLAVMLRASGEADDPHLEVDVVVRHDKAGPGLDITADVATKWLARLAGDARLRTVKGLLGKVATHRDHGDLILHVDLGRSRDAVGTVALLAQPLFAPFERQQVRRAVQVEVAPAAEPEPQPR